MQHKNATQTWLVVFMSQNLLSVVPVGMHMHTTETMWKSCTTDLTLKALPTASAYTAELNNSFWKQMGV